MATKTKNLKLNKPDGTDAVDITVLNANADILDEAIPKKVDKVAGKQLSTEDYTTAEKTKLAGIAGGAQVNVIEGVTVNGSAVPVTGKTADVTVPTKVSDLTNDAGFITKAVADLTNYYIKTDTYTRSEVLELVNAIPKFTVTVVDSLPASGDQATIYFIPVEGKGLNVHDEYIWVNNAWEQIGSTAFELDIVQDASGINVNGTILQDASATQDGLLTKEAYNIFAGKQDAGDYLVRDADGYTRGKLWFDAETWFSKPINIGAGTYKIDTNGQAILSWIKLAGTTDLNAVPPKYPVLRNDGWIYSRTLAEMITDLGIDGKQPAGDYLACDDEDARLYNGIKFGRDSNYGISGSGRALLLSLDLTQVDDYGHIPPSYLTYSGSRVYKRTWAEMITDLGIDGKQPAGDYALKSEIPDITNKLDNSGGTLTSYLPRVDEGQIRNIFRSKNAPQDSAGIDGDIWIQYE